MLLRSYSAPILNSWISSRSRESSPESRVAKHSRNRSMSFAFEDHHPRNHNSHRTSGPDVRDRNPTLPNKKTSAKPPATPKPQGRIKDCGDQNSSKRLLSNSGLGEDVTAGRVEVADNDRVLVVMGGGDGGGGRRSDGGYGYDSYDPDHGSGHDDTDDYYQKMIEENPGSSLLLANYAKFLKEVKGDYGKAEEYCERAILGNRSECDGNVKCLYGDLIWKNQKDAGRAHIYFDEALKTDPNDCYVLASYARFLWDAEEDGQEGEEEENADNRLKNSSKSPGKFFEGSSHQSPITAVP